VALAALAGDDAVDAAPVGAAPVIDLAERRKREAR
jgi:hypothetical protein